MVDENETGSEALREYNLPCGIKKGHPFRCCMGERKEDGWMKEGCVSCPYLAMVYSEELGYFILDDGRPVTDRYDQCGGDTVG